MWKRTTRVLTRSLKTLTLINHACKRAIIVNPEHISHFINTLASLPEVRNKVLKKKKRRVFTEY